MTITWSFSEAAEPQMTMVWRESGGPSVVAPTRQGFGRTVMDRIAGRALGGRSGIAFEPAGVLWTLEVPAAAVLIE